MIIFLMECKGSAAKSHWMVPPVHLLFETAPPLVCPYMHQFPAEMVWYSWQKPKWWQSYMSFLEFQRLPRAPSNNETLSDFLLAPSPARYLFSSCAICPKPPKKPLVMAHEAEEGTHLCICLGQCTFCDHLQVRITGSHTFFGYPVWQIVDLLLEKTTFCWLKFQIRFSKSVKDHLQPVEMSCCLQEYDNVIQVY